MQLASHQQEPGRLHARVDVSNNQLLGSGAAEGFRSHLQGSRRYGNCRLAVRSRPPLTRSTRWMWAKSRRHPDGSLGEVHRVNSRCPARTSSNTCGDALLELAPTKYGTSELRSRQAMSGSEMALSSLVVRGVNSPHVAKLVRLGRNVVETEG